VLKAFQKFLLAVWVLGLLLAVLDSKLLLTILLLVHSVGYDTHEQSDNK
jgi:hypothetical protein